MLKTTYVHTNSEIAMNYIQTRRKIILQVVIFERFV